MSDLSVRQATGDDAEAIALIYSHFALHTTVTFEEQTVTADQMLRRMEAVEQAGRPWLVATLDRQVVGYACAQAYRPKPAYRHTVEPSVYVHPDHVGLGYGRRLFEALLDRLEGTDVHAVVSLIALPHAASERLHAQLGFTRVGVLTQVGRKFDQWIDVAEWQLTLGAE